MGCVCIERESCEPRGNHKLKPYNGYTKKMIEKKSSTRKVIKPQGKILREEERSKKELEKQP